MPFQLGFDPLFVGPDHVSTREVRLDARNDSLSNSLTEGTWTALPTVPGDGTFKALVYPFATGPQGFYRVRVE
jgi:hypothetical protein